MLVCVCVLLTIPNTACVLFSSSVHTVSGSAAWHNELAGGGSPAGLQLAECCCVCVAVQSTTQGSDIEKFVKARIPVKMDTDQVGMQGDIVVLLGAPDGATRHRQELIPAGHAGTAGH